MREITLVFKEMLPEVETLSSVVDKSNFNKYIDYLKGRRVRLVATVANVDGFIRVTPETYLFAYKEHALEEIRFLLNRYFTVDQDILRIAEIKGWKLGNLELQARENEYDFSENIPMWHSFKYAEEAVDFLLEDECCVFENKEAKLGIKAVWDSLRTEVFEPTRLLDALQCRQDVWDVHYDGTNEAYYFVESC